MKKTVVGLGEVLWDILPGQKQLGGAPANFAYITRLMGDEGIVASRVGADPLGHAATAQMEALGLSTAFVQCDRIHPTGSVNVDVDAAGNAQFKIQTPAAWDFLEWTTEWQALAQKADAVCFGSLAQRSPQSRDTIVHFLGASRPCALRIYDVNLRPPFYSREVLAESLKLADIVKMNDSELPEITQLVGLAHLDERSSARQLIELFHLKLVCLTKGSKGSVLVSRTDCHKQPGFPVKVADTVGAGDAFTAALAHEYLRGASLELMNQIANQVGAWVASEVGATPTPKHGALEFSLEDIG